MLRLILLNFWGPVHVLELFFLWCAKFTLSFYVLNLPWSLKILLPFSSDSEDSDHESTLETRVCLMEDVDLVESALSQLTYNHLLNMKVFNGVYNLYFFLLLPSSHFLATKYECNIHFIGICFSWNFMSIPHVTYEQSFSYFALESGTWLVDNLLVDKLL